MTAGISVISIELFFFFLNIHSAAARTYTEPFILASGDMLFTNLSSIKVSLTNYTFLFCVVCLFPISLPFCCFRTTRAFLSVHVYSMAEQHSCLPRYLAIPI